MATPRHRNRSTLTATVLACSLMAAACSSPAEEGGSGAAPPSGSTTPGAVLLATAGPHRYADLDFEVVDVERRPDGPNDAGEDVDPSEDFVYLDVDVTSPVPGSERGVPYALVQIATSGGSAISPISAVDRDTGDPLLRSTTVVSGRTQTWTIAYAVDASDDLAGAWPQVAETGYEPTALGGPNVMDEAARRPVTVLDPVYDGPFALDEARIEVVDAWVSRELGTDDEGLPLDPYDGRRPKVGFVHLVVKFDVSCRQIGITVGGCGVSAGQVVVDGRPYGGEVHQVGSGPYDSTATNWATYPLPVGAKRAVIQINGGRTMQPEVVTDFVVDDLTAVAELTRP